MKENFTVGIKDDGASGMLSGGLGGYQASQYQQQQFQQSYIDNQMQQKIVTPQERFDWNYGQMQLNRSHWMDSTNVMQISKWIDPPKTKGEKLCLCSKLLWKRN